jgi:hypothetical protein
MNLENTARPSLFQEKQRLNQFKSSRHIVKLDYNLKMRSLYLVYELKHSRLIVKSYNIFKNSAQVSIL